MFLAVIIFAAFFFGRFYESQSSHSSNDPVSHVIREVVHQPTAHGQTVALKPGQTYSVNNLPEHFRLRIRSNFPVNVNAGGCSSPSTTDADMECETSQGDSLLIVDARPPALILGRYNSVAYQVIY